jgi:hypothetical protein
MMVLALLISQQATTTLQGVLKYGNGIVLYKYIYNIMGHAVMQLGDALCLSRKVAGSIFYGVIRIFL